MTAYKSAHTRQISRRSRPARTEDLPPVPGKRLWKTDKDRAIEAAARWFLAVSRRA